LTARSDLAGAAVLGLVVVAVVVAAEAWARLGSPRPEWTRKLVHTGGGVACLLFPFFTRSPLLVFGMAAALSLAFVLGGRGGWLRSLHRVERPTHGAEYYPVAISLLFLLARDQPWLYVSSVLVLAVADALAALVGGQYGTLTFEVQDERKSVEGSIAFFLATFLAVHLPTLLMTDLPRATCVLSATLAALLLTGLEIVCLRGTDNLFLPLASFLVLSRMTTQPLSNLVLHNLGLLALTAVLFVVLSRVRLFNPGGAVTFLLFSYATWALGSLAWAAPVFAGFAAYTLGRRFTPGLALGPHRVRTMTRALLPPLLVLILANSTRSYALLFGPYLAASAAVLAFALRPEAARWAPRMLAAALVTVVVLTWPLHRGSLAALVTVMLAATIAVVFEPLLVRLTPAFEPRAEWSAGRFLMSLAAAALVLAAQAGGVPQMWGVTE